MLNKTLIFKNILWIIFAIVLFASCRHKSNQGNTSAAGDSLYHSLILKKITDSIRQFPDSSRFYFERGGMLYVMKEYKMAGKDIQKAIDLDPEKEDYYIAMGEIYLADNQFDQAEHVFRKALQLNAANEMARLQLSYTLFQQKNYKETIRQTDTLLREDKRFAEAYGLQSQAYIELKDTVKAISLMNKAVSLAPENYNVLMAMGDMLLATHNRMALLYYERAKKADTTQAEPFYCIGLFYENKGERDSAIAAYKSCIGRDAYYLEAYINLGKIYENKNDWKSALKIYKLATEIDPKSSQAFYRRGICYEKLDQPENALNDYENAYSLKRTNTEAREAMERLKKHISSSKN